MNALAAYLRRHRPPSADSDGELLGRYLATGDEAAFAELVRRYGPLVWGACRRHLPDPADAEDVFQATWLVLVRKAKALSGRATVGPWLYRVAAHTARNLRRRNAHRLSRRRPLPDLADTATVLRFDLDDALLSLPEKYRTPVVLCHLQGWTRREAAEHLGCPEGTLSALLSRALAKLRAKLGDPTPALLAAAGLTVPVRLADAAVRSATVFRTATLSAAVVSPAVADLTRGALRMFWLPKLVAGGMATLACLAVGLGVGLTADGPPAAKSGDRPKPVKAAPPDPVLERARAKEAEANYRRAKAALERAQTEFNKATADLEVMELQLLAGRMQAEAASPFIKVVVRPDADGFVYGIDERGSRYGKTPRNYGEVRTDTDSPKVLEVYLAHAKADPTAPKSVRFEVVGMMANIDPIHKAAAACVRAGFRTVIYTGPLPEKWSRGVTNDGKPTTTWNGRQQVKDKEVDLTKVLPLHETEADVGGPGVSFTRPAADQPMFFLYLPTESPQARGYSLSDGMRVGDVLKRAYGVDPGWIDTHVVYMVPDFVGKAPKVNVDWRRVARGDADGNYRILPGTGIHIEPKSPADNPNAPRQ